MKIHKNFVGGNVKVISQTETEVIIENELRDTTEDWFYWAFCVEGAEKKTVTFHFQKHRLGYFGPAISYDLVNWHWLDSVDGNSFTYHFKDDEKKVYFAYNFLYHPDRFFRFAGEKKLEIKKLCDGYKGSEVPCVEFGSGDKSIIMTARHHACEATGSFVLEGVLDELLENPIDGYKIFCVPFVDYEGVIRGDQGKSRAPFDHNRDYDFVEPSIYPETAAIKKFVAENECSLSFDFHAPWFQGGQNDTVFIVQNNFDKLDRLNRFGEVLESCISEKSLKYYHKDDMPFMTGWNMGKGKGFSRYMTLRPETHLGFTLETTYAGLPDNAVTEEKLIELGHCFARAIKKYIEVEKL